jgi:hypothetical protein
VGCGKVDDDKLRVSGCREGSPTLEIGGWVRLEEGRGDGVP